MENRSQKMGTRIVKLGSGSCKAVGRSHGATDMAKDAPNGRPERRGYTWTCEGRFPAAGQKGEGPRGQTSHGPINDLDNVERPSQDCIVGASKLESLDVFIRNKNIMKSRTAKGDLK